jgi:WD40 repeat protein
LTLRGHTGTLRSVVYSPDGARLACAAGDNSIKLWDARTGAEIATLRGHSGSVSAVCYNRDGSRLASISLDHTIKVWDARSARSAAR